MFMQVCHMYPPPTPGVLVMELLPPMPRPLPRPAPFGGGDFGLRVSISSVFGMTG